jgi:aldehyde dehydrogenase (NAD+)
MQERTQRVHNNFYIGGAWAQSAGAGMIDVINPTSEEPVGGITPWNYPLHQVAAKVGPVLAAGCTVVRKPCEVAPLGALVLADIVDTGALPAGVFNLESVTARDVGEALAAHLDVDMVPFTGSTRAGTRVCELAARTIKRVALELGGKSPNILLDDLDAEGPHRAVTGGGGCASSTPARPAARSHARWCRAAAWPRSRPSRAAAEGYTPGDPFSEGTTLGPLVSEAQRERARGYIERGLGEGARLITGGAAPRGLGQTLLRTPGHDQRARVDLRPCPGHHRVQGT